MGSQPSFPMGSAFSTAAFFNMMLISVLLVCSIQPAALYRPLPPASRQLPTGSFRDSGDSGWTLEINPSGNPPGDELPNGINDDLARGAHPEGLKLTAGE